MFAKNVKKLMSLKPKTRNLINEKLPAEIIKMIFHLMKPRDMNTVVLVCKWWRDIGEAPSLWQWATVTVTEKNLKDMPNVLEARRLEALRSLGLRADSDALLLAISKHPGLKSLDMHANINANLSSADPILLAKALGKLESVSMFKAHLTKEQLKSLMSTFLSGANTHTLNIGDTDISTVAPSLLASAINMLNSVGLYWTEITHNQITAILTEACDETKLSSLTIMTDERIDKDLILKASKKLDLKIQRNLIF